ncbi:hypothetical protein ACH4U5_40115, partial [Streptomyces sp. NPDC020858]|uniref:hypothetical protein n=1 Tax=Streptomyces sp. NPDC020858 TaxID=3365097 RepID=UPI00378A15F8
TDTDFINGHYRTAADLLKNRIKSLDSGIKRPLRRRFICARVAVVVAGADEVRAGCGVRSTGSHGGEAQRGG